MQEVVVNFVIRMAFLLGDAIKDPDFLVRQIHKEDFMVDSIPRSPYKHDEHELWHKDVWFSCGSLEAQCKLGLTIRQEGGPGLKAIPKRRQSATFTYKIKTLGKHIFKNTNAA